jgi:hypothetical protein
LQEASASGAPDEKLARKAGKAEGRLRDELGSVWPELSKAAPPAWSVRRDAPGDVESFLALLPAGPSRVAIGRRQNRPLALCRRRHLHGAVAAGRRLTYLIGGRWLAGPTGNRLPRAFVAGAAFAFGVLLASVAFSSAQVTDAPSHTATVIRSEPGRELQPSVPRHRRYRKGTGTGRTRPVNRTHVHASELVRGGRAVFTAKQPEREKAASGSGRASGSKVNATGGVEVSGSDSSAAASEEPGEGEAEGDCECNIPQKMTPVGVPTQANSFPSVGTSGGSVSAAGG